MTWEQTLTELHRLQTAVKARSMIYQVDSKEEAAQAFNRPLDYFYHWSYRNWSRVSKMLVCKRELVMNECVALGIPGNMPFSQFPHYQQRMGLTPAQ